MVDDKSENYMLINNGVFTNIECTNNKGYKNKRGGCYYKEPVNFTKTYTA